MKLLFASLVLLISSHARAVTVSIGKPDAPAAHRCEVESMEVETRYHNQPNRVVLALREARGANILGCPASVAITVDSREEALKMFEVIKGSTEATCFITDVVTARHNKKSCDAGFNAKVKM